MAHFAKINLNNIVENIIVINNNQEHRGLEFINNNLNLSGNWIQTSYNTRGGIHTKGGTPLRKNYAGIGYSYDPVRDAFIPPKKYSSWILDDSTCQWTPPIQYPLDGKSYVWNECIVNWFPYPTNPTSSYNWSDVSCSWEFMPMDGKNYKWNNKTSSWVTVP